MPEDKNENPITDLLDKIRRKWSAPTAEQEFWLALLSVLQKQTTRLKEISSLLERAFPLTSDTLITPAEQKETILRASTAEVGENTVILEHKLLSGLFRFSNLELVAGAFIAPALSYRFGLQEDWKAVTDPFGLDVFYDKPIRTNAQQIFFRFQFTGVPAGIANLTIYEYRQIESQPSVPFAFLDGNSLPVHRTGLVDADGNLQVEGTVAISGIPAVTIPTPVPVTDNAGSLTVDGTVAISGTPAVTIPTPVPVTDNAGSLTVDGTVAISGTPTITHGKTLLTAKIDESTSGDRTIISGAVGVTIYIYAYLFNVDGTIDIIFKDGSTALTGNMAFSSREGSGQSVTPPAWLFKLTSGNAFVINLSAIIGVNGYVCYWTE